MCFSIVTRFVRSLSLVRLCFKCILQDFCRADRYHRMETVTMRTTRASLSMEEAQVTKEVKKKRSKKNVKFEDTTDMEIKRSVN